MGLKSVSRGSESRFPAYVEALRRTLGHADRVAPFRSYCAGLLLPGDRKSVEPMAARVQPGRVQAAHQSLHHFVAKADWSDEAMLDGGAPQVLPAIERHGPVRAWIIDDTGFPKKGTHSVGVARQYCGQLGKQDNCQVAVSLSVANDHASLPIAYRLYLPEAWADDPTGVAGPVCRMMSSSRPSRRSRWSRSVRRSPPVSLPQVAGRRRLRHGHRFRDGITELGLAYVVGIQSSTSLWPPGRNRWRQSSGVGAVDRPPGPPRREHRPVSAKALALDLPKRAWRRVTWREGSNTKLASRFAAVRVRPAHRDYTAPRRAPRNGA